jgi:hypothetical protein
MVSLSIQWWICSSQYARRAMNVTRKPRILKFGDSLEMGTETGRFGPRRGSRGLTASLLRDYDDGRDPMPKPGDLVIMVGGKAIHSSSSEPPR